MRRLEAFKNNYDEFVWFAIKVCVGGVILNLLMFLMLIKMTGTFQFALIINAVLCSMMAYANIKFSKKKRLDDEK